MMSESAKEDERHDGWGAAGGGLVKSALRQLTLEWP